MRAIMGLSYLLVIVIVLDAVSFDYEQEQEHEQEKAEAEAKRWSHAHYLISAINVEDLAGNGRSTVAGEKNSRSA